MADEHEGEGHERRPFDIESALNSLIARNSNSERQALRTLSEENYGYRRTIRDLKKKIADLSKRPELKDGERVIAGDRVKVLEDFEALKVKVEDVKNGLSERDTLKSEKQERKKAETIAQGVKHLRMNGEVMADLIKTRGLQQDLREIEVEDEDGKKESVKVLHLRSKDDEDWVRADKYAEKNLKGYLPALKLGDDEQDEESENDEAAESSNRDQDDRPRRQPFPRQASGTGSKAPRNSTDVVDKHLRGRYVTPSQLRETQRN